MEQCEEIGGGVSGGFPTRCSLTKWINVSPYLLLNHFFNFELAQITLLRNRTEVRKL